MEFNKVCRTCLSPSEDMISLYEACSSTHMSSADMLMSFISLKCYENDGLPKQICYNCVCVLNRFHTYRLKCLESDEILRNDVTTNKNTKKVKQIGETQNHMGTTLLKEPLSHSDVDMVMGQTLDIIKHEIDVDIKSEIDNSTIETKTEQFSCSICNNMFKRKDSWAAHMRQHTGEKPHSCTVCSSSFLRKDRLAIHMRKHAGAGQKSYTCSVCNSSFSRKDILVVHMRQHIGEKPYSCTVCNKSFVQKDVLLVHMRAHTGEKPYSCTFCDSSFTVKSGLTKHMRKHTGEKPYTCAICSSSFDRKDTFTVHMRKHTGEKPYACTKCNRQFTVKTNLTSHMRKHL